VCLSAGFAIHVEPLDYSLEEINDRLSAKCDLAGVPRAHKNLLADVMWLQYFRLLANSAAPLTNYQLHKINSLVPMVL